MRRAAAGPPAAVRRKISRASPFFSGVRRLVETVWLQHTTGTSPRASAAITRGAASLKMSRKPLSQRSSRGGSAEKESAVSLSNPMASASSGRRPAPPPSLRNLTIGGSTRQGLGVTAAAKGDVAQKTVENPAARMRPGVQPSRRGIVPEPAAGAALRPLGSEADSGANAVMKYVLFMDPADLDTPVMDSTCVSPQWQRVVAVEEQASTGGLHPPPFPLRKILRAPNLRAHPLSHLPTLAQVLLVLLRQRRRLQAHGHVVLEDELRFQVQDLCHDCDVVHPPGERDRQRNGRARARAAIARRVERVPGVRARKSTCIRALPSPPPPPRERP